MSLPPERLGSCLTRLGSGVAPLLSWILDFSLFHKVPAHGDSDRHRGQIAWLVGKGLSELLSWLFPVWTNISVMLWNKTTFGFFFFFFWVVHEWISWVWLDILYQKFSIWENTPGCAIMGHLSQNIPKKGIFEMTQGREQGRNAAEKVRNNIATPGGIRGMTSPKLCVPLGVWRSKNQVWVCGILMGRAGELLPPPPVRALSVCN